MDKTYTLKVSLQNLVILRNSIEKIQLFGKDAIVVADIYSKVLNLIDQAEKEQINQN